MSKLVAVVVLLVMAVPAAAQEMTLQQVLDNYYEAIGGLDAWESVGSMKIAGSMSLRPGMEVPFTRYVKRPDKVRVEATFQGQTVTRAYDGETAWMIMPFRGSGEPEVMDERQARGLAEDADLDGVLVGWRESGHQIELAGRVETEGTDAYKLDVTLARGDVVHVFLDAEYFVPIRIEGSRTVQGTEREFVTTLSDYKEVDGLLIAHSAQTSVMGGASGGRGGRTVKYNTVEIDASLEDSLFAMPGSGSGDR